MSEQLANLGYKYRWWIKVKQIESQKFGIGVIEIDNENKTSYKWEDLDYMILLKSFGQQIHGMRYPRLKSGDIITIELDLTDQVNDDNWVGSMSFGIIVFSKLFSISVLRGDLE